MIRFINFIKYNKIWWLCDIILEGKYRRYDEWLYNEHMELLDKLEMECQIDDIIIEE